MEKNKEKNNKDTEVHIEQIDPRTELNDLEKTAILQFKIEKEAELSKTNQFKILNSKHPESNDLELPKKKLSLGDTIKLKISDLREAIDERNLELPMLKQRKSLYDTVIIKLDNIINNKSALKNYKAKKITKIETPKEQKKKIHLLKPRDISKMKNFKLNVDSEEFGRQLYNLNKIALTNLSGSANVNVRKHSHISKLKRIEKIHLSKRNYQAYQKKISRFAINKLYYKLAPKETNKYKLYKASVILSGVVFVVTSLAIVNWFIQGVAINNLSNSLVKEAVIEQIDGGILYNLVPEEKEDLEDTKTSLYWKYLNTSLSSVDFTELLKQNKDTVGWIIVNNTNINYPIVQTTNNDYYLKHSFDRSSNNAGWVYADFRNSFDDFSKNTVIYAHGRKDKVMFGSLINALDTNWIKEEENQIIQLSTIKYNTMWQIISVYKIKAESYYITTDFSSDESFLTFANTMLNRSIYDFNIDVDANDKLLTLSTCYNDNGIRLVVHAKLVKIQER